MSRRICVLTELVEEGDPRSIKLRERLEHGGRGAECVGERDESRGDHGEQCRGGEDLHERERTVRKALSAGCMEGRMKRHEHPRAA